MALKRGEDTDKNNNVMHVLPGVYSSVEAERCTSHPCGLLVLLLFSLPSSLLNLLSSLCPPSVVLWVTGNAEPGRPYSHNPNLAWICEPEVPE